MTIAFAKKSPRELVELRLLLDVGIAELACQKVSEKNIDELVGNTISGRIHKKWST